MIRFFYIYMNVFILVTHMRQIPKRVWQTSFT